MRPVTALPGALVGLLCAGLLLTGGAAVAQDVSDPAAPAPELAPLSVRDARDSSRVVRVFEIHHREGDGTLDRCMAILRGAVEVGEERVEPPPLIHRRL